MTFRKTKTLVLGTDCRNRVGSILRGLHQKLSPRNLEVKLNFLGAQYQAKCRSGVI